MRWQNRKSCDIHVPKTEYRCAAVRGRDCMPPRHRSCRKRASNCWDAWGAGRVPPACGAKSRTAQSPRRRWQPARRLQGFGPAWTILSCKTLPCIKLSVGSIMLLLFIISRIFFRPFAMPPFHSTTHHPQFRGLSWDKRKKLWRVRIYVEGKQVEVGRYKSQELAATAYDCAAIVMGETRDKCLNFTLEHALQALPALEAQKRVYSSLRGIAERAAQREAPADALRDLRTGGTGGSAGINGAVNLGEPSQLSHGQEPPPGAVVGAYPVQMDAQQAVPAPVLTAAGIRSSAAAGVISACIGKPAGIQCATAGPALAAGKLSAAPAAASCARTVAQSPADLHPCSLAGNTGPGPLWPSGPLVDTAFLAAADMDPQAAFVAGMQASHVYFTSKLVAAGTNTPCPSMSRSILERMQGSGTSKHTSLLLTPLVSMPYDDCPSAAGVSPGSAGSDFCTAQLFHHWSHDISIPAAVHAGCACTAAATVAVSGSLGAAAGTPLEAACAAGVAAQATGAGGVHEELLSALGLDTLNGEVVDVLVEGGGEDYNATLDDILSHLGGPSTAAPAERLA
ncbi:MAG: hypothetical protein J3K34DRAFT_65644 [Monoraphidium minutum]|nr:MAG: hypothetical protein J3K34DRAFT_65644 [Monoraphidium minutum]